MRTLALDLGTKTGWAAGQDGVLLDCGTWTLATPTAITNFGKERMNRRLDPRVRTLWDCLTDEHALTPIDWLVFEDVEFASSRIQAHLWASFRTVVWLFAAIHRLSIECVATGTLKKFATGHGGATKEMMAKYLLDGTCPRIFLDSTSKMPQFHGAKGPKILDDNSVDAVHILRWSFKTLRNV